MSPSVTSLPRSTRTAARSNGSIGLTVVREVRVTEDDHGRLQMVGEVERLPRELERVGVVAGREHDARELALRGMQGEAQVALLGPRGKSRSPDRVA